MPNNYCPLCGLHHRPTDDHTCKKEQGRVTWQRTAKSMAMGEKTVAMVATAGKVSTESDESDKLSTIMVGVNNLSLDECERSILADIERLEREDRIADLEVKRKKLLLQRKRREIEPYEDKLDEPTADQRGHHGNMQFNAHWHLSTDGHSSYGLGRSHSYNSYNAYTAYIYI